MPPHMRAPQPQGAVAPMNPPVVKSHLLPSYLSIEGGQPIKFGNNRCAELEVSYVIEDPLTGALQ
jgi:hypothetical protein